jgi:hypothetical protein
MSAEQVTTTSTHDDIAASTAAGVDKAIQGAEAQGTTVGSVPGGSAEPATVESVPATAEQLAVDESYKSGESPYEFSQGKADASKFEAEADKVYGK